MRVKAIHKCVMVSLALLFVGISNQSFAATAPLLAGVESAVWPGYDKNGVYVPDSVDTFRFIMVRQTPNLSKHDQSCYAIAAKCIFVTWPSGLNEIKTAANATRHPELPYLPVIADGETNFIEVAELKAKFPGQVFAQYTNFDRGLPRSEYPIWTGLFQNQDDKNTTHNYGGSQSNPEIYYPNWGWPHGYYGANTKTFQLYEMLVKKCIAPGWNKFTSKPTFLNPVTVFASTEYRGDPGSWFGPWPKIYPKSQYPGNPNSGVWLPNEEYAFIWRAAVSRHPTQTQYNQGENNAVLMSNASCYGQPNIMVTYPSRSYQPHRMGGTDFPLYAINSVIDITVANGFHANVPPYDFQKLELFDGNRKLKEITAQNLLNIYVFKNCTLSTEGQRTLICVATLKDGSKATSRPAIVYVTSMFKNTTGIAAKWTGRPNLMNKALTFKGPAVVFNGKASLRNDKMFDIRGSRIGAMKNTSGIKIVR